MWAEKVSHGWNRGFWQVVAQDEAEIERRLEKGPEIWCFCWRDKNKWWDWGSYSSHCFFPVVTNDKWLKTFSYKFLTLKDTGMGQVDSSYKTQFLAGNVGQITSRWYCCIVQAAAGVRGSPTGPPRSAAGVSYHTRLDAVSTVSVESAF